MPSGVSYVLANRSAMRQQWAGTLGQLRLRPVSHYPQRLLAALRKAAPQGSADPCVVVLTPGVFNSAYFEHAWLARAMGVELVEGRDLICSGGIVRMRDTAGERRVDVIYRRVDDDYLDPVQFRADSTLGCPGLLTAARAGNVTIANAVGNGVADDKLIYTYLPDLVRYYLGEEPVLPNVDTWRLEEPGALEEVLDRLDELVVKPVDGAGGKGLVIGPQATRPELDALRLQLLADPRGWIAQPVVQLSTVPTFVGDRLAPRHVDLRPFAVNDGNDVWVLPGGLTRVALVEGSLVVNSSQGGGSKDTWVLAGERARRDVVVASSAPRPAALPRARSDIRRLGSAPRTTATATATGGGRMLSRHRRIPLLDRALRRAGRRHQPHPRRPPDPAARRPVGARERRLRSLLSAMGREVEGPVSRTTCWSCWPGTADEPASVIGAIGAARENARRSREIISTELWENINVTWHESTAARSTGPSALAFFTWVRERAAAFNGVADATISRDDAWHFLRLGRSIERADMTARLVAARALSGDVGPSWVTLLQSCGAYQAFLRSARGAVEDRRAIEFLLLDSLFPRSLISALVHRRALPGRPRPLGFARRIASRAAARRTACSA